MTPDKHYLAKEQIKAFTNLTSDQDQQKVEQDRVLRQEALQISIDRVPPTNSFVSDISENGFC
jgi:hypothetical protein